MHAKGELQILRGGELDARVMELVPSDRIANRVERIVLYRFEHRVTVLLHFREDCLRRQYLGLFQTLHSTGDRSPSDGESKRL